jgi:hypothetical protein
MPHRENILQVTGLFELLFCLRESSGELSPENFRQ